MTRQARIVRAAWPVALLLAALVLAGCGDEGSGEAEEPNAGWVQITAPTTAETHTAAQDAASITVGGDSFISPEGEGTYRVCSCAGIGCFFGNYCEEHYTTGVTVMVTNVTTGFAHVADQDRSRWSYEVPLEPGENRIKARAYDKYGNAATDSIMVTVPTAAADPPPEDPPEAGLWRAPVYTGGTTQLELRVTHDPAGNERWAVHGWGFCSPSYCDWGTVPGERLPDGDIYAIWDFGWKTTEMWAGMSASYPGRLEAYMWDDYSDADGRTDRGSTGTFVRVP